MTSTAERGNANAFTSTAWIAQYGATLAKGLSTGLLHAPVRVTTIRRTDTCLVLDIAPGTERFLVKAFNPSDPESQNLVTREINCLTALRGSGLVPDIALACPEHRFLAMTFIEGPRLLDTMEPSGLDAVSVELGAWFARFTRRMPGRPTHTTWLDYLSRYPALADRSATRAARELLSSAAIGRLSIAKNDAFLGNFLRARTGELIGIDFETAAFKPFGWDILDTARVLCRRYPQRADEVVAGLIRGWGQGTESLSAEAFSEIARCFVRATALGAGGSPKGSTATP